MAIKLNTPKGTRDFSPAEMVRRNYIFDTIKSVFKKYGYQPIETPSMENSETLMGKYGDEGDRLIFKILNSGDFLKGASDEALSNKDLSALGKVVSEKALRYDLTVPFARYVVQHRNEITFPFKRYQIQPVWRADRPQKGRYREFYQCDADVIGSKSSLNELELVQMIQEVFLALNLDVEVKINDRRVLQGLSQLMGIENRMVEYITILDKYDKVGKEGVSKELSVKEFNDSVISRTNRLIEDLESAGKGRAGNQLLLQEFETANVESGVSGIKQVGELLDQLSRLTDIETANKVNVIHDLVLARGLSYYTGIIIEVIPKVGPIKGSICGGGRYDDLTGIFGMKDVSGVGISFGADRIYDVLEGADLFPEFTSDSTQVFFVNFGTEEASHCLGLVKQLREAGINTELYPDNAKMKKQMTYAHNNGIQFVAMVGTDEMESGKIGVKNMTTGEQSSVSVTELITLVNG